jgi:gluconolactonase
MTFKTALVAVWSVVASAVMLGQGGGSSTPSATVAPSIPGVVAAGTKVQLIVSGLHGGEGPVAMPDGSVLFTEQDVNKILRIDALGKVSTYLEHTNRATGLAYDRQGRLIGVGSIKPQVLVFAPTRSVLAETFEGEPLLHPGDLVVDRKGGIYFADKGYYTDPLNEKNRDAASQRAEKPAIFYLKPSGQLVKVTSAVPKPNGIELSPDEKTLYVAPPDKRVFAFDVQDDGSVRNQRTFVDLQGEGGADGFAVDEAGRLYAATRSGVEVISPQGKYLGTIPIPIKPANLAFAGPNKKTLYVVSRGAAYKIDMIAEGIKSRAK